MDVLEAIKERKSIRKFKPDTVSKDILEKIIEAAVRAPSAENTQPWEFVVLTGDVLEKIKNACVDKVRSLTFPPQEMERLLVERPKGSIFRERQIEIAKQLFRLMKIEREDKKKRAEWLERGFRYFDAPVAIIITADQSLPVPGTFFDIGAVTQTLCLSALRFGLHTCVENQGVTYADVIREFADIPMSKQLIISIAIGYPDWDFPANQVKSTREAIGNTVTWHDFP